MAVPYDYYRIFYHVAQQHSFTRAAAVLGNNQPNVTRCMNNLEQELGCRLFLRSNRGITLTPEGEKLFAHVRLAYDQLRAGEEELRKDSRLENGVISISASETALHLLLMKKLADFHERFPNIQLRITNDTSPQAIQTLAQRRTDCAVITTPCQSGPLLQITPLMSFREVLVGGSNYRNLASKVRSLKDVASMPFVCLGLGTSTYEFYQRQFSKHDLSFRVDMEAATMDQVIPMVRYNLGIGFVPEPMAQPSLTRGELYEIKLSQSIPDRQIALVENAARNQSIAFRRFKELLLEEKTDVGGDASVLV